MVSTDPIVLVGPGSEWFWSMAQFVVVAVTLIGIYYQLRLQRAANAFEQLNRIETEWNSEYLMRVRITVGLALKSGERPSILGLGSIAQFWEGVASLVRGGHIDARVVYESLGNSMRYWWVLLGDEIHRIRALESEASDLFVHFEWLEGVFANFARRDGTRAGLDRETLIAELDRQIEAWQERVRMYEASRAVTIATEPKRPRRADQRNDIPA
jgi:hypothetical protein